MWVYLQLKQCWIFSQIKAISLSCLSKIVGKTQSGIRLKFMEYSYLNTLTSQGTTDIQLC